MVGVERRKEEEEEEEEKWEEEHLHLSKHPAPLFSSF